MGSPNGSIHITLIPPPLSFYNTFNKQTKNACTERNMVQMFVGELNKCANLMGIEPSLGIKKTDFVVVLVTKVAIF
jgi:hypothetical protein